MSINLRSTKPSSKATQTCGTEGYPQNMQFSQISSTIIEPWTRIDECVHFFRPHTLNVYDKDVQARI